MDVNCFALNNRAVQKWRHVMMPEWSPFRPSNSIHKLKDFLFHSYTSSE